MEILFYNAEKYKAVQMIYDYHITYSEFCHCLSPINQNYEI